MFNIAVIRYYLLRPFTAQCSITLQFSISTDQLSSCPFEYAPPDRDVCSADSVSCHVQHRYAPLPRTRQVPPSLFFFNRQQLDNSCRFFYLQVLILCHPLVQCFHCPLFSFYGSGSYRKIILQVRKTPRTANPGGVGTVESRSRACIPFLFSFPVRRV